MNDRTPTLREHLESEPADKVLRDGMQNSLNRAPLCCCEGVETVTEITPGRPWILGTIGPLALIVGGVALAGALIVAAVKIARAAERHPAFEIVAYPAGKDLREDRPNLIVIAGPYAGREECRIAIAGVKLANGSRLRCDRIEDRRVR